MRFGLATPFLVFLMGAGVCGGRAGAEPNPGSVSDPPRYFSLDHLDAYLEVEGHFDQTRVRSSLNRRGRLGHSQSNREWGFEERIGFNLGGWAVDPGVIGFQGDVSFALTEDHFTERSPFQDQTDNESGFLLQYDLRADFFTGKKLSGSVYGLRQDDRISRRFQPTLDESRTGFGTSWHLADERFPMELRYDYLETDRTGNRDRRDDEHFTESTLYYNAEWIITDHHHFKLSYEHAESKQEYQGLHLPFDTTRDLFTLEHDLEFGSTHEHSLHTLVHWQEESGDFARDFFEINPQLTLKHSDALQTSYKYQFDRERYEAFDIATHRADFQLVHQVYSNLITTIDLFGLYEEVQEDADTVQYGASVDWQYNRKNRFGHLYANLGVAYDTEDVRGDNGVRVVLNESATFRDPIAVTLRNRNVILNSIVVTDTSNRRFFLPGTDFLVWRQRDVVRLARVPGGRIAEGDGVLIDYQYATPANGKVDTLRVDFNLEQQFTNGITPYYRWSYRNQELGTSTGFARYTDPSLALVLTARNDFRRFEDRTDHHRLGVRYEQPRYSMSAEYEIFDDAVEPYHAFHLDGVLHIVQTADHSLDSSARLSRFFFKGGFDKRNVTLFDLELDHRRRLKENLSTFERVAFRWEDDSVEGLTHAWDAAAGMDYVIGELTAQITLEYDRLSLPGSVEDDFGVYFRVRRDIPNVLAQG